jgi:hypothetical protein
MKPSEILRKAAERIATPDTWAQGDVAFNEDGEVVGAKSSDACRWCMAGALIAEGSDPMLAPEDTYLDRVLGVGPNVKWGYVEWQDIMGRQHSEVVEALLKAAALAESEGQ